MKRLSPAGGENNVPVVFAADQYFLPYTAVMIHSVLEHASADKHYDIILLYSELDENHRRLLLQMTGRFKNCTMRFCDVSGLCGDCCFYTETETGSLFTKETYYRLLLGDILSEEYERAIYLDGDMIACTDVAALLDIPLDGYYLAAAPDMNGIGDTYQADSMWKRHREEYVKIKDHNTYFIAGLLVLNLRELRRDYSTDALLKLALQRNWMQHDQDVLNHICRNGKAKLIHPSWGVTQNYGTLYSLPKRLRTLQRQAEAAPLVIHYAGTKPWNNICVREHFFWKTAAKTEFFEGIIARVAAQKQSTCTAQQAEEIRRSMLEERCELSFFGMLDRLGIQHEKAGIAGRLEFWLYRHFPALAWPAVRLIRKLYKIKHGIES